MRGIRLRSRHKGWQERLPGTSRFLAGANGIRPVTSLAVWSPARIFTRAYGSTELDASLLPLPLVGFPPPSDQRVLRTVEAVQAELCEDGLVRRYAPTTRVESPGGGGVAATEAVGGPWRRRDNRSWTPGTAPRN